jgi:hypothetical protein
MHVAIARTNARLLSVVALLFALAGNIPAQPSAESAAAPKPSPPSDPTVALAPFVVSGDKQPWRYGTLPGAEVLTRADDKKTAWLLSCYARTWQVENEIIPKEWLRKSPVPYTIIIDDSKAEGPGFATAAPPLTRAQNFDVFGWKLSGYRKDAPSLVTKVTPLNGWIHAADDDTTVLGANVHGHGPMLNAPTWVDRIDRCVPSLPRWVTAGLVGPQGLFEDRTVLVLEMIYTTNPNTAPPCAAIFRGIRWISTADSQRLRGDRSFRLGTANVPFIPLREFFSELPPPPEQRDLWESEAGLLVRWGLLEYGKVSRERRANFVKFVERQRSEPVTEKMLIECFGQGYADMEQELKGYLRRTLGAELHFRVDDMVFELQPVSFRPATPDQVGRIIGDWQRMQAASLQDSQPTTAKEFRDAADRTLSRAWLRNSEWLPSPGDTARAGQKDLAAIITASEVSAAGNPDPDFLAVCGLYEYDLGEYKLARDVLEIATSLHTTRPKAYLVLAELRAREATAKPAGKDGALSTAQAVYILQPLRIALPSASSARPWRLMVDTLVRCESTPSAANLDTVIKGTAQFPRDAVLQLETARLCLKAGEKERATEVIDKAFLLVVDVKERNELQELRAAARK